MASKQQKSSLHESNRALEVLSLSPPRCFQPSTRKEFFFMINRRANKLIGFEQNDLKLCAAGGWKLDFGEEGAT